MENQQKDITNLISGYLLGEITAEEYHELQEWLNESPRNKAIFSEYLSFYKKARRIGFVEQLDQEKAWKSILEKLRVGKAKPVVRWFSYAAAVLIPLALLFGYYLINFQPKEIPQLVEVPIIEPGGNKAILYMANGEKIELNSSFVRKEKDGTVIENQSNNIKYTENKETNQELVYNTIYVPRKGEFQLELSDGTKVWLNSDTKLVYPTQFGKGKREVQIEGEAFFEVKEDHSRPFIVNANGAVVEVFGTSFNVKSYKDDNQIVTTLVSGKVKLVNGANQNTVVVLSPGKQGIIIRGEDNIQLQEVNTQLYTSWKDGMFIFKNLTLDEIMKILGRWYDVKVSYENPELKSLHFSGDLERYKDINTHLDMISLTTNVTFKISKEAVLVEMKKR